MTYNDTRSSIYKLKISKKSTFSHHLKKKFYNPFGIFLSKKATAVKNDNMESKVMLNVDTGIGNAIKMDSK